MKQILQRVLLLFLLFSLLLSCAFALEPTRDFYVNDYAGVLFPETSSYMLTHSMDLAKQSGAQIVVLTVPSLDGKDIATFALEAARDFQIGDKNQNNGILILLAVNDRRIRVEVGYGLEGVFPDSKVGRYLDSYALPYFADDDFDTGLKLLYDAIATDIYQEYHLEIPYDLDLPPAPEQDIDIFSVILIILLLLFFFFFPKGRNRNRFYPFLFGSGNRQSFQSRGNFGGGGRFGGGGAGRRF